MLMVPNKAPDYFFRENGKVKPGFAPKGRQSGHAAKPTKLKLILKSSRPKHQNYQGWANWDTWETALIYDNDEALHRNQHAWQENFLRNIKRGNFDEDKAAYAIKKYVVKEARKQDPDIDPSMVDAHEIVEHWLQDKHEQIWYDAKAAADAQNQREMDKHLKDWEAMAKWFDTHGVRYYDHAKMESPKK